MLLDFKFGAPSIQLNVHKEPPEVVLVKKVNRMFVLVGDTARANPT